MVLQGSPDGILDDLKRAVDDGVNTYKVSLLTNDENKLSDVSSNGWSLDNFRMVNIEITMINHTIYNMLFLIIDQAMCRDSHILPGAASTEVELARKLKVFALKQIGYLFMLNVLRDIIMKCLNLMKYG